MILLLLLILPVLFFSLFKNQKERRSKTLYPPSPPGLPIIGNLHQFDSSNPHLYLFKLASTKYGPLMSMKLGKVRVLIVSSAKMAKEVLKTHDLIFCSRPPSLGMQKLSYGGLDVAFSPYNDSWRELRKLSVLHLLSNKQVHSFRPIREDEVIRMLKNLEVAGSSGEDNAVNLSVTMLNLTSTLICRIAFGKRFGETESERRRFDELMIESQAMQGGFFVSDFLPWFSWVDKLSGMLSRLDKTFRDMDEFYQEMIDEHLDPNYKDKIMNPNNILDMLIQLKEQKLCSIDLTWDHIKAVLFDIFVAGTDTSAAVTIWAMTALIKSPDAMEKLQNEIRETIGNKGFVNENDVPKLPYLKAVIQETLRLYPPAPLLLPRETLEECIVEGYTIPPKTLVHINAWAIARDPQSWENANEFLPERFLNSSIDVIGKDFEVIPFGAGRRGCPGVSIGLATVDMALANLVYSFDWELPKGVSKEDIDTDVLPGITMHKKNPLCLMPRNYVCA
ncbi:LOW QUALITY PROTEIN: 6,7,8-trihydroxycoumarin synthase-like [Primulina eburnea]|uniref:LOW QUALITY PROTEIN: 6,7,8-trihydroxycoumarin synthase-like n=1 Tax=Primulina eburnea TaxID=1245227 RepID=UPI003C6CB5AB